MAPSKAQVAIVGGGVAGLVTATLLHGHGMDVRLFERTPVPGAVGAGIQLSPNGVRVLHRLGLADALARTGVRAGAIETRRWDDGSPIARVPHGTLCDERFDAPHVIEESKDRPIATDHADRCERIAGNFFESVPSDGDVYLLSRILHCFDDEACHRILINCRRAMAPGGKLVILERVLVRGTGSSLSQGYNMHMLVVLGGGRERDETQYRTLLDKAGFTVESVHGLPLETHLMVAAPS